MLGLFGLIRRDRQRENSRVVRAGLVHLASFGFPSAFAASLLIPNGNMELPVVGAWSTTMPTNWTWTAGSGVGDVGLTSTGGANGSQQTLYGNQIAGTLTSAVLSQAVPGPGSLGLSYWTKRENTGLFTIVATLYVGGSAVASQSDVIATNAWTQYTLNYSAGSADVGESIQVQFTFTNGSGAWQGYLDEVTLEYQASPAPSVSFVGTGVTQPETSPNCTVNVILSNPATNTVTVSYYLAGGTTAIPGIDFNFSPGTLTFPAGVVSNSFSFTVVNNSTYQIAKIIEFSLNNPVNAVLGTTTSYTVRIVTPTTYYVDSVGGNDANSGTDINAPWKTLANVNGTTFESGDNILLKAGSVWTGQLQPLGSGDINGQVTVDMYGSGAKPLINAGGINGGAVYLLNQQYWSINNLEISNYGTTNVAKKQGILIKNDCVGTLNSIYVHNCYIHDVNGVMDNYIDGKESGGIVFYVTASNTNVPSNWNDLRIENNTISNVVREGILLESFWVNKPQDPNTYWSGLGNYYPSTQVRIASNILERIGGDGIITWAVNGAVVEYNCVKQANNNDLGQGHAGIWPYICENVMFQFNEVCETQTKYDGMAFDFDDSNQNCVYQYNYSHENQGGFLDIDSGGDSNGNIARYNISQNDGCLAGSRVFTIYGPGNQNDSVYNNTIYVGRNNPAVFEDDGGGSSGSSINFYNNIFINQGTGAVYNPAGCVFDHNLFFGNGYVSSDTHRIVLDPQLAGAGSGTNGLGSVAGYKLMTNSPAIGAGVVIPNNGGLDYWGNAVSAAVKPNMGAYNGTGVPETPPIPIAGTNIIWSVNGTNLFLSWPTSYIGWRLLMQTNNPRFGISGNPSDWWIVPGSNTTNHVIVTNDQTKAAEFYRLAY